MCCNICEMGILLTDFQKRRQVCHLAFAANLLCHPNHQERVPKYSQKHLIWERYSFGHLQLQNRVKRQYPAYQKQLKKGEGGKQDNECYIHKTLADIVKSIKLFLRNPDKIMLNFEIFLPEKNKEKKQLQRTGVQMFKLYAQIA